jgi:hypothetical protein
MARIERRGSPRVPPISAKSRFRAPTLDLSLSGPKPETVATELKRTPLIHDKGSGTVSEKFSKKTADFNAHLRFSCMEKQSHSLLVLKLLGEIRYAECSAPVWKFNSTKLAAYAEPDHFHLAVVEAVENG